MAGPDDQNPSDSSTERGRPLNVRDSALSRVQVTRMNAQGDIKELQEELLKNVCDCIEEQTDTLKKVFERSTKDIIKELKNSGGSGGGGSGGDTSGGRTSSGDSDRIVQTLDKVLKEFKTDFGALLRTELGAEGGGGGGGGLFAEMNAAKKEFIELEDVLEEGGIHFKKFGSLFKGGITTQLSNTMREVNERVFRFGQRISDLGAGTSDAIQVVKDLYKTSQTGMIEVTAIFEDLGAAAVRNRDALQSTVPTMMKLAEAGNLVSGVLGNSAAEVATAFKANRETIEKAGIDLGRIPFDEQNEILSDLLQGQRRAGIMGDNASVLQSRYARDQLDVLQNLAFMTGKSVASLMAMQKNEVKTLEELFGLGVINEAQFNSMRDTQAILKTQGQESIIDLFTQAMEAGGTEIGLQKVIASSAGMSTLAGQGNNMQLIREAFEAFKDTSLSAQERADRMTALTQELIRFQGSSAQGAFLKQEGGGILARIIAESQGRRTGKPGAEAGDEAGGMTGVQQAMIEAQKNIGKDVTSAVNQIDEYLKNNLGGMSALVIAVIANTAALTVNTAAVALSGGRFMSLLRKIPGLGRLGMAASSLAGATTSLGATVGPAVGGLTAGGIATGALGVGAALGGGYLVGTGISKAYENVGEPGSIGTDFANFIGADATDDATKKRVADEVARLKESAAQRQAAREAAKTNTRQAPLPSPVAPNKGVIPTAGDVTTVTPSPRSPALTAGIDTATRATTIDEDPTYMEMLKQSEHLVAMIELLQEGNRIADDMATQIGSGAFGSPGTSAAERSGGATNPNSGAMYSSYRAVGDR